MIFLLSYADCLIASSSAVLYLAHFVYSAISAERLPLLSFVVYIPKPLSVLRPFSLLATIEKSWLSPDLAALIKNLWLSESKFTLSPDAFNCVTKLFTVISSVISISFMLPSTLTEILPSFISPIPVTLVSLESPVSLVLLPFSPLALITPPVRYPVAASLLT